MMINDDSKDFLLGWPTEMQSLYPHVCLWSSLRSELGSIRASHAPAGTSHLLQHEGDRHLQGDSVAKASDNILVSAITR